MKVIHSVNPPKTADNSPNLADFAIFGECDRVVLPYLLGFLFGAPFAILYKYEAVKRPRDPPETEEVL